MRNDDEMDSGTAQHFGSRMLGEVEEEGLDSVCPVQTPEKVEDGPSGRGFDSLILNIPPHFFPILVNPTASSLTAFK
jgi:hypothetical protein